MELTKPLTVDPYVPIISLGKIKPLLIIHICRKTEETEQAQSVLQAVLPRSPELFFLLLHAFLCSLCQSRQAERSLSTLVLLFPRSTVADNIHCLLKESVCSLYLELSWFKHNTTSSQHCVDMCQQIADVCLRGADYF